MVNWEDPVGDLIKLKNDAFKDSPTSWEIYSTWRNNPDKFRDDLLELLNVDDVSVLKGPYVWDVQLQRGDKWSEVFTVSHNTLYTISIKSVVAGLLAMYEASLLYGGQR